MNPGHPDFFDLVAPIVLRDPLAEFLGAAEDGLIAYRYLDAVKLAGHSCPTVAGAWAMTRAALRALYPDGVAERGAIAVTFRQPQSSGVTGVIANVVGLLTGAAGEGGFKGIGGRFGRHGLLVFAQAIEGEIHFARRDGAGVVQVAAHLQRVPADPAMAPLLARCAAGEASDAEVRRFRELWQARVRAILLDHVDDPEVIEVRAG